jgi:hypothetical protein
MDHWKLQEVRKLVYQPWYAVVDTPTLYSGVLGFESRLGDGLSWLTAFMVFLIHSSKYLNSTLNLTPVAFFQIISNSSFSHSPTHPPIRFCVIQSDIQIVSKWVKNQSNGGPRGLSNAKGKTDIEQRLAWGKAKSISRLLFYSTHSVTDLHFHCSANRSIYCTYVNTNMNFDVEVYGVVTPCSVAVGFQRFGGQCCLHLQGELGCDAV